MNQVLRGMKMPNLFCRVNLPSCNFSPLHFMELPITTPGLLFPAISLMMLAHTNRFLALSALIRSLSERYRSDPGKKHILVQVRNLRSRLNMIRSMQIFGLLSFLLCAVCMGCVMYDWSTAAIAVFAISLLSFVISLIISMLEILLSMRALETELEDMEALVR